MKFLGNQLIAREGVLPYEDGKKKLKKWEDLKQFIGKKGRIVDEHPEVKITMDEKIWGFGEVKQCPNGEKALCADMYVEDDAPDKIAYSIGYLYIEENESGEFEGETYDSIQRLQELDHIALTNYNREPRAVKTLYDSKDKVNKYFIGYDTYMINKTPKIGVIKENKMAEKIEELMTKMAEKDAMLAKLTTEMKLSADSNKQLKERDQMIKDLETKLKSEVDARVTRDALQAKLLKDELLKWKIKPELLEKVGLDALKFGKMIGDSVAKLPRADSEFVPGGDSVDEKPEDSGLRIFNSDTNEFEVF